MTMKGKARLVLASLMTLFCWTASATEYITDVMLVGAYAQADYNNLVAKYTSNGWKATNWDLNHGIAWGSGDAILLLYKTAESNDGFNHEYITDFYIQNRSAANTKETLNFMGRTYNLVPVSDDSDDHFKGQYGDLNSHTGASTDPIHLYYTKETFADNRVITGITFNETKSGGVGCEGNTKTGYDLNAGCSDLTSQQIYMHLTTATAPVKDCYISEVKLVGAGTSDELDTYLNQYAVDGWKVINYDLNKGINWGDGDGIYLLYKTAISPDGLYHGYITDFYLENKLASQTITPITYHGREYNLVPYVGSNHFVGQMGDLNSGTGASTDAIHLFYTKERFLADGRAVNGIYFNATQSGAVGKEGGSTGYNLNAGTTGSNIYMHFTTASTHKNASPIVSLKSFTFSAKKRYAYAIGWAFDPDEPDLSSLIRAEVYSSNNKLYKTETFRTWVEYSGANSIYNITGEHGFGNYVWLDEAPADTYTIKLYAEDLTGDPDVQIGETQTVTITRTKPIAYLDKLDVLDEGIRVRGWAFDPDLPNEGIPIRVEVKRPGGSTYTEYTLEQTDVYRGDLNSHPDYAQYGLTGNHGFDITVPIGISYTYNISVYAEDITGEEDVQVGATETIDYTHIVRLTSTTGDVTLRNGDVLTGTGGPDTHVIIADRSLVTLNGVNITAIDNSHHWAGITCEGYATIVLADGTTNKVTSPYNAGILVGPPGYELAIEGNGRLEATSLYESSGIGAGYNASCGSILISGGTIVAKGGAYSAGIGSRNYTSCGDITITNDVTSVTATAGTASPNSIGKGVESSCGTVTIGGIVTGGVTENPITYEPGVTPIYTITYNLDGGTNNNRSYYLSQSPDITLAEPVRFHYDFVGWTWEGQEIPVKNVTIAHGSTGNKVFTAHWEYTNVAKINLAPSPYMSIDGDVLTGTGNADTHITIADGATVTLSNVDITGITNDNDHKWAGISCLGDATIILAEGTTNNVKGGHEYYPGIYVPENNTLTIQSSGFLEACSNGNGCGIGGGYEINCGNIVIVSGKIEATVWGNGAAIGSGYSASCGNITISNGITWVHANSRYDITSIGAGELGSSETVSISDELTKESDHGFCNLYHSLILYDLANNSSAITAKNGRTCFVTLDGRLLYADDDWNTLCLPFPLNEAQIAETPFLDHAVIMELDGEKSNLTNGTLTLNFTKATSIVAGRPYIVKATPLPLPTIETTDDVVEKLKVFNHPFIVENGQTDDNPGIDQTTNCQNLVDGYTESSYVLGNGDEQPWVEFHCDELLVPQGYALWTAGDDGAHNPASWTIKARNSGDTEWTILDDSNSIHALPWESNTPAIYPLSNTKPYQFFRFEAQKFANQDFQLADLQFYTLNGDPTLMPVYGNIPFRDVTINATASTETTFSGGKFVGTYNPVNFTANDKTKLFVGAENKLHWPSANMTLGACRAYFDLGTASASEFVLNFDGEEDNTTGIIEVKEVNASLGVNDNSWYDLSGRKLDKQPTEKGLYIHNGKKVVIK